MKRRFVLLLMSLLLMISQMGAGEGMDSVPDGFCPVASDFGLSLYANQETGEIMVMDLKDGYMWFSNPQEDDKKAKGVHKTTLQSQLTIDYSSERGTALSAISQPDSFKKKGYKMTIVGDEIISTYDFPKQEISVTMHYALRSGGLEVWIPVDETSSYGTNTLTSVEVLPAFGAGGPQEQGYILVPDGSGALIRFNNGTTAMNEFKANVYGKDPSVDGQSTLSTSMPTARTYSQKIRMPVFGICKGGHGMLGIITQNDSKGVIHAKVSNLSSYNTAWSEFELLSSGTVIMNKKEFDQTLTGVSERKGLTTGNYCVRYMFLNGEKESAYPGMAQVYRDYLTAEKGLMQRTQAHVYPLYLDLYGYVDKTAHILGIPYTKAKPLTTLEDITAILQKIGVDQTFIRYRQYLAKNAYGKLPRGVHMEKSLGSVRDLRTLSDAIAQAGGGLFPDVDMVNVYRKGNGFRPRADAVLTPVNSPQMQYQIRYNNSKVNETIPPWYLLSPIRYDEFYGRYLSGCEKNGISDISLSALGDILTADNRTRGMGRQAAEEEACAVLKRAGDNGSLMIDGGNAYAAALATHVVGSPSSSSMYTICDEEVPFWQMVFHGSVYYSLSPGNQAGDFERLTLQCLETGASPMYAFVGRNKEALLDSRMVHVFSADADAWADIAREQYDTLCKVLESVSQEKMTGHAILSEGVRRTDYESRSIYVNYGDDDAALDGLVIPARGYLVKEGTP